MKKIINERPQIDPSPTITTFNSLSFSLVFFFSAPRFSHFSTSFLSLSATPANTQHRHLLTCAGGAMSRARSRSRSPSPSPCCGDSHLVLLLPVMLAVFFNSLLLLPRSSLAIRPTESDRIELANATESSSNVSLSRPREGTFADMIDRALEHEFTENDQNEATADPGSFNNSVAEQQAVLETVARVTPNKNDTKDEKSFQLHHVFNRAEETPMLIDRKDNVFIISNFKSKYPVLQLDLRLISDLVVAIVSATCGGVAFAFAGQPVITGYLLAGSIVGPGGFNFISEMVQVETVAQFGVIFLLFALGLEFSATKLRVVRAVAVIGGLLQIFLFMCMCGLTVSLCGGKASEGVFVGAFLSMSSTAVVLKFLMEKNTTNALHGQVTIGTLILQDCAVGLLFALLPVLGGTSGVFQGVLSMTKLSLTSYSFTLQIEPIRNLFAALFLASIGMLIHVHFLWNHVDILVASVILVIVIKTIIIASVVKGFGYNNKTSIHVGMSMAQIGEFAFVLLSRASNLHLVEVSGKSIYLTTVTTPLLFKLIPAVVHLGVLLRWFSTDSSMEIGYKLDNLRSDSGKQRIILMDQESHDS
ncbi:hypothetical protein JHK82_039293 [Glycine max]|nr:hypothetical protein JHK82_039293 [Glycine max]